MIKYSSQKSDERKEDSIPLKDSSTDQTEPKSSKYKTNTNFEPWSEKRVRQEAKKRQAQMKTLADDEDQVAGDEEDSD